MMSNVRSDPNGMFVSQLFLLIKKDQYLFPNISFKYVFMFMAVLVAFGCATWSSSNYSCKDMEPWMSSIKKLSGNTNLNKLTIPKIAYLVSPAFNDEVFTPIFNKPYSQLSQREHKGINNSLNQCFPVPWVTVGISTPFKPPNKYDKNQPLWQRYISEANNTTFETAVAQREQQVASREHSIKQYKEQQRQAWLRQQEKNKKDSEDVMNIVTGVAAAVVGIAIANDLSGNSREDFSQYGDCAPKLEDRLARCYVGRGDCDIVGCSNDTECYKGFSGMGCERYLNSFGETFETYYCDTETKELDKNKKYVITKICEK